MVRKMWKKRYPRVVIVWMFAIVATVLVVVALTSDLFEYESVSGSSTDELERACLAASVVMFDVLILTQVWRLSHPQNLFLLQ